MPSKFDFGATGKMPKVAFPKEQIAAAQTVTRFVPKNEVAQMLFDVLGLDRSVLLARSRPDSPTISPQDGPLPASAVLTGTDAPPAA